MTKVKLTLTIDESVVAHAKAKARRKRQSLSEMIERFLASPLPAADSLDQPPMTEALQLRGIAKSVLSKKTDKQIKAMMYRDKYGV